ncbi:MAG: hypothetical protein JWN04_1234 [Myxococcaceae bacterium]|nr:hypothetical protein [Myxococcaceae bacterium]
MFRIKTALIASALIALVTSAASAQVFNPTITPGTIPITVTQTDEKAGVRPKVADQRLVNIAFGATANAGNSKTYAGNLGGRFGLIRNFNQLTIEALGTIGGARTGKFNDVTWTSRNVIARARYDLFLSQYDALFVAIAPRRDKFAGLDLRLQNQVGYLRNLFFPVDAHRFWTELGYDFTYDRFSKIEGGKAPSTTTTAPPAALTTTKQDPYIHSARVFFGYTNRLSPTASLSVGVENLFDFKDRRNVRVNGLVELTSSITHTFKLGLQSRVLFDNVPVSGAKNYDAIAVAQLVYTFDSAASAAAAACPVCDCTAQVQAARTVCRAPVPTYLPAPPPEPAQAPASAPAVEPAAVPESVPTVHPAVAPAPLPAPVAVPGAAPIPTP